MAQFVNECKMNKLTSCIYRFARFQGMLLNFPCLYFDVSGRFECPYFTSRAFRSGATVSFEIYVARKGEEKRDLKAPRGVTSSRGSSTSEFMQCGERSKFERNNQNR